MRQNTAIGLLIATMIACVGCGKLRKPVADAYVQIPRDGFQGTAAEFLKHKESHAIIMESPIVLNPVIADPQAPKGLSIPTLSNALTVNVNEDELLHLQLKPQTGWSVPQTEYVLNAVIKNYLQQVVQREAQQTATQIAMLNNKYQDVHEQVLAVTNRIPIPGEDTASDQSAADGAAAEANLNQLRDQLQEISDKRKMLRASLEKAPAVVIQNAMVTR